MPLRSGDFSYKISALKFLGSGFERNQDNSQEKYRGKLGQGELLVFHSKPSRWSLFIEAFALTTIPFVINKCTHFKLRFLQN